MLLQTNSYIVPKDKRSEHARLLRRFRQVLHRLGCDQFEVYEQVGSNWNTSEPTGRYVQIMKFRDRRHQVAVQTAERSDPSAQALIAEFCQLINFPYQQQQGLFAVGFYNGVVAGVPSRVQGEDAAAAAAGAGVAWPVAEQGATDEAAQEAAPAAAVQPPETPVAEVPVEAAMETPAASEETLPAATPAATEDVAPVSGEMAAAVEEALVPSNEQPAAVPPPLPVAEAATPAQAGAMDAEELVAMAVESDRPEGQKAVLPPPLPQMPPPLQQTSAEAPAAIAPDASPNGEDDLSALLDAHAEPAPAVESQSDEVVDDLDLSDLEIEPDDSASDPHADRPRHDHDHVAR
jgi:hypothetical protein